MDASAFFCCDGCEIKIKKVWERFWGFEGIVSCFCVLLFYLENFRA